MNRRSSLSVFAKLEHITPINGKCEKVYEPSAGACDGAVAAAAVGGADIGGGMPGGGLVNVGVAGRDVAGDDVGDIGEK